MTENTPPAQKDGTLKVSDMPIVYAEFKKDIDIEGLQASQGALTKKGYDTLGYGYAWISERLNDVVGPQCWRMVISEGKHIEVNSKAGNTMHEIVMDIVVQLGNWKNVERNLFRTEKSGEETTSNTETSVEFEVIAQSPPGFGWHRAMNIADARKGAMTNGFKKAAGFLGLGNEAYKKNIDEENQEVKKVLNKKSPKSSAPQSEPIPPNAEKNFEAINKALEARGAKTVAQKIAFCKKYVGFECNAWAGMSAKQINFLLVSLKNNAPKLPTNFNDNDQ